MKILEKNKPRSAVEILNRDSDRDPDVAVAVDRDSKTAMVKKHEKFMWYPLCFQTIKLVAVKQANRDSDRDVAVAVDRDSGLEIFLN